MNNPQCNSFQFTLLLAFISWILFLLADILIFLVGRSKRIVNGKMDSMIDTQVVMERGTYGEELDYDDFDDSNYPMG